MSIPSPARMYDALLGGSHNFEIDRAVAERAATLVPDLVDTALANRAFLRRVVRYALDLGIRQFLDIGAGIPAAGSTHEIARRRDPTCRVVYVDIDPVAVAHGQAILAGDEYADAVAGDLRDCRALSADPRVTRLLDLDRPVCVLLVAVLHMLSDDQAPAAQVAVLRDRIAPGSLVAISHLSAEGRPEAAALLGVDADRPAPIPIYFRSAGQVASFFTGLDLIEPGLVELPRWRPDPDAPAPSGSLLGLGGVGRRT